MLRLVETRSGLRSETQKVSKTASYRQSDGHSKGLGLTSERHVGRRCADVYFKAYGRQARLGLRR
jgi:hypothetical protein